jgi:hypothetical protein
MAMSTLRLPLDIMVVLEEAARRAGVPVRSPLLDKIEQQDAPTHDNVIPFRRVRRA